MGRRDRTTPDLASRYAELKENRAGLSWRRLPVVVAPVDVIVDVGASNGTPRLYQAFPDARFIIIDALEENRERLEKFSNSYRCEIVIAAVGASSGSAIINIAGNRYGSRSSILPRQGRFENDKTEPRRVNIERLDDLIKPEDAASYGLKLDIEGYELEALKGAEALLTKTKWVVAETSLSPRFKNDPMFEGIYQFLQSRGFAFRDIVSLRRNPDGGLRLIDAVFSRQDTAPIEQTSKT